ncbi:hypothetical protein [Streptosporangium sp. 'caverna']|uniref:hypothetical protein n=1 Tax=Streptosporangium sp. 'caverna' TaxID=2202249 RepID=UPI0013A6B2D7|nr:hypothetical protein [Streptosporangium sp. 'caverna']
MPRTDLTGDEQPYVRPAWPEPAPGAAQPWTVPGDDGAPYDWLAEPEPSAPWSGSPQPGSPQPGQRPGSPAPQRPPGAAWSGSPGTQDPSGATWPGSPRTESNPPTWAPPSPPSREPVSPGWSGPSAPAEPSGPPWPGASAGDESSGTVPMNNPPLPTAPIVPGAPPWQPPPAFTAAAAGMQVWPDTHWPAATGEPVWSDPEETIARPGEPGDIAVWPPDAVFQDDPGESVRGPESSVRAHQEQAGRPQSPEAGPYAPGQASSPEPGAYPSTTPRSPEAAPHTPGSIQPGTYPPGAPQSPEAGPYASGQISATQPGAHPPGAPQPPEAGPYTPGQTSIPGQTSPPQPGAYSPTAPRSSEAGPYSSAPSTGPTVQSPMPAPVTQAPTSEPELISQVPAPPLEPVTHAPASPQAPGHRPGADFHTPDSGRPTPPPGTVDQDTPPGGIPMLPPLFPPLPVATPINQPAPASGALVPRDAFTPASAVVPEPPTSPPAEPARSRGNTALIAAVAAVVVIGIATGAIFAYQSISAGDPTSASAPIPAPEIIDPAQDPVPEPEPINTTMLDSEKTDPGKLTVPDAFTKKVTLAGATFTRVKTNLTEDCRKAAAGKFARTLDGQDCRRVLRATYVDSKKKYAVTTGIAVLPTRESAIEADKAKDLKDNLWFRSLPGNAGSGAERVHIAGGYAAGMVWGRYIVFSYATFSDGHTPTAKEKSLGKVSSAFRDQTAKVVERRVRN